MECINAQQIPNQMTIIHSKPRSAPNTCGKGNRFVNVLFGYALGLAFGARSGDWSSN